MKRTPLARRTPLRARKAALTIKVDGVVLGRVKQFKLTTGKPQRRAKRQTKHARRPRGFEYMGWVKRQPCFVAQLAHADHFIGREIRYELITPCSGPIEADHAGKRTTTGQGDGKRAYDRTCIPLCSGHHRERHDFAGTFADCPGTTMRDFLNAAIITTQLRARAVGVEIPDC